MPNRRGAITQGLGAGADTAADTGAAEVTTKAAVSSSTRADTASSSSTMVAATAVVVVVISSRAGVMGEAATVVPASTVVEGLPPAASIRLLGAPLVTLALC